MAKRIIATAKRFLASDDGKKDENQKVPTPAIEMQDGSQPLELQSGNPVLKIFLEGVYDDGCELSRVRGMWHILKKIWQYVTTFWKEGILVTTKRDVVLVDDSLSFVDLSFPLNYSIHPFISIKCEIRFPKPSGLYINMMPFIMAKDFEGCKLPDNLLGYWSEIIRLCPISKDETGKIGYLTIHESHVEENNSQRRPGLHTERPGRLYIRNEEESNTAENDLFETGDGLSIVRENQMYLQWGIGHSVKGRNCFEIEGGIFMASNVDNSCRVWDCQITNDAAIGHLGDIEHLREYLPSSEVMKANHLYWMTDRTPHESLCLKKKTFRQYFRLVTSQVSLWFEEHSTKNPLGIVPDPEITKIVGGSKFVENGLYFVKTNTEKKSKNKKK